MDDRPDNYRTDTVLTRRSRVSPAIEITDLTKRYGATAAVDNLSLTVESGEIYGFLGPNGAGKSTTINLLMDYVRPTEGEIKVLDRDPRQNVVDVHQRVGILPDQFGLYEDRTGRAHVELFVETKQTDDDPVRLLERVGLGDNVSDPVGTYSRGMRQRLALAMALVGDPELLILDEPFGGLDPHGVRLVRKILHERNEQGTTVFFSSHVLRQVELVCDRFGILSDGRLVAEGTLEELRKTVSSDPEGRSLQITVDESQNEARDVLHSSAAVERVSTDGAELVVELNGDSSPEIVVGALEDAGIGIRNLEVEPLSMESIFLAHTDDPTVLEVSE